MEKSFAKNRRFIKNLTGLILLLLCTVDVQGQKQTSSQFEVCGVFHADSIYLVRKTYTRWNWRALHWGPYHCTDYYVTTTLDKKTKRLIQRRPLDSQSSEKVMRVSPIQLSKCLTLYSKEYKQFPIIDTFLRNLLYDNLIFHCGKAYRSIDIGKQMAFVSELLEDEGNTSYHLLTHTHYFLLLKMSVAAFNEANYPLCMCGGDTTSPPYRHSYKKRMIHVVIPIGDDMFYRYENVIQPYMITTP
ncbi:MAG: hypothetical protein PUF10_10725 [Bacteroidales bacterium]|nr:hypothetical protein [Bacteroidales bacterium]